MPDDINTRAPGKATRNGEVICPCASWAQPYTDNVREFRYGRADLDHAPLCNGHGEPTRGLPTEVGS